MRYEGIKDKKESDFKRLVGVKKKTFEVMVECLQGAEAQKKKKGRKYGVVINQFLLDVLDA